MPQLSEWHIYGNEQQGRFSVKKPDYDPITDPLYYLDVLKDDVTKKNFFRILDKKQYELKDHLGNVRVAIGDMKIPTAIRGEAPFVVDEKSVSDFYPGGMSISDRSWQGTSYRYGYNAQEKSLEIDASGNHHTAEFWEVNNASLRRWNRDPKPTFGISEYSIFGNNPNMFSDRLGDTTFIDYKGYISRRNDNETDKLVYTWDKEGKLKLLGEMGGKIDDKGQLIGGIIDVKEQLKNLLDENSEIAKSMDILDYFLAVMPKGEWDLKQNKKTIFGKVWEYDESHKKDGSEKTKFKYFGMTFSNSADVGNYHAGFTGKFTYDGKGMNFYLLSYGAGLAETFKTTINFEIFKSLNQLKSMKSFMPPFGDNPTDFYWNVKGMSDSEKSKKTK
jgi:hypothetical protein